MNIVGIVVEYNPLHNGHLYHLQNAKIKTNADLVIAVMSGSFLQRGEPALLSKWERTQLALQAGVDIVIELPYSYATQKAEIFAWGAVALLNEIGATHLCFGSEAGSLSPFLKTLESLKVHKDSYDQLLKAYINEGYSYPKSSALAFKKLGLDLKDLVDLSKPNNILGYHYIEAVQSLKTNMKVETLQRIQAGYHETEITHTHIASATAIRKALFSKSEKDSPAIGSLTPEYTAKLLTLHKNNTQLRGWEHYFSLLKYRLITDSGEQLSRIYEAEEGLENRLKKMAINCSSYSEFMNAIKTKRYTWTRLQRLCTHILTGTTKTDMHAAQNKALPDYVRLLGMSTNGQRYLNKIKKEMRLPLITKIAGQHIPGLEIDIRAAEVYHLLRTDEPHEYQRTPIRYERESNIFL
mgnify:CR=1 FL=1